MALITVQDIHKYYGEGKYKVEVLKGLDFTIDSGEFVAIMGPSGSGKSTLLSILGAMNKPDTGKVVVDDIDVYDLSIERLADFRCEYLGFIFQQLQLIPYLTAVENVMLPLVITSDGGSKLEKAKNILKKVGLDGKEHRLPSQLSGGEQGRVAIARALVNEPPILMADEPTGSLDTKTGEEIMALFDTLNQEGQTIIMVTHSPENAARAHRVINIRDGNIINDTENIFSTKDMETEKNVEKDKQFI